VIFDLPSQLRVIFHWRRWAAACRSWQQQYSQCEFSAIDVRVSKSSHCPRLPLELHIRLLLGVWLHFICWYWCGCTWH